MNTVSELTTLVHTGDVRIDSLLDSVSPWNFLLPYRNTLYYTFDASDGSYIDGRTSTDLTEFNASQQDAARGILGYVSGLIGVSFVEVGSSETADVHFGATDLAGASNSGLAGISYSYSHSNGNLLSLTADATIWLDNAEFAGQNNTLSAGSSGYETLLHEIGHMLGLGHTFNSPNTLPTELDNTNNTVMSYTTAGTFKSTFQQYDLWALTWIYGGDGLAGDWGYNSVNGLSLDPGAEDIIAPGIEGFTPADDAGGVSIDTQIEITFDEPISRGSGTITLKTASGQTVEIFDAATSPQLAVSSETLTITPSSPLSEGTEYRLEIDAGSIEDLAGNDFAGYTDYNFTTLLPEDTSAPEIESFSPADGAVSVALDSDVTIVFDENISAGAGSLILRTEGGTTVANWDVAVGQNLTITGDTLTLELPQDLEYDTHYLLEIPSGAVEDLSENDFAGTSSYDFTTLSAPDTTAPQVTQFSPADNSSAVAIDSTFRIYFNEPIYPGSGNIVLQTASGATVETFKPGVGDGLQFVSNELTIYPSTALANSTEYRIIFSTGAIEDLAGNPIAAINHYSFTTKAADAPADDYAGDPSTTGELPVNGQITGELEIAGDKDWFRINLTGGEKYQFELLGSNREGGTLGATGEARIVLHQEDGSIVESASLSSVEGEPLLTYIPLMSDTYYLSAEGKNNTETGTYTLLTTPTSNNQVEGELIIFGNALPGDTLFAETRGISDADVLGEFSFQWLRDGEFIPEATNESYILQPVDVDQAISVQVSYIDGAGFGESLTSESRLPSVPINDAYIDLIEMYVVILGRAPDKGGLEFWSSKIDDGRTFEDVANAMWNSPGAQEAFEFLPSDEDKVATVYRNVLAREPDEGGLAFWLDRWQDEDIGPVETMLRMINALTANNSADPQAFHDKILFQSKVDIGGYVATSIGYEDAELGRSAFSYLESGHTLEQTIDYIDQQLDVLGQQNLPPEDNLLV